MRTIVKGKNAEVPERVRDYAERKLKRIERLLDDRTDATIELWSEQHRSAADSHFAEVTLVIGGHILRSRGHRLELPGGARRRRRQGRAPGRRPQGEATAAARPEEEKQILRRLADGSEGPRRERRIVKVKRFAIEPMFEEDALAAWRSSATCSSCSSARRPSVWPSCTGETTATTA